MKQYKLPLLSGTQNAPFPRSVIWSYVTYLAVRYTPHDLKNGTIFGGGEMNIKCMFRFSLQLLSETFFILGVIL
jgi:hypothetical protein